MAVELLCALIYKHNFLVFGQREKAIATGQRYRRVAGRKSKSLMSRKKRRQRPRLRRTRTL